MDPPYKKYLLFGSAAVLSAIGITYFLTKRKEFPKSKSYERKMLIKKLTAQSIEITRELERLLEEDKSEFILSFDTQDKRDSIAENQDYSIPLNDPAINQLKISPSKIFIVQENQKMKDKLFILGDYKQLQEKEYEGNYKIFIKDIQELRKKLSMMKDDGIEELQIVSDFDFTTSCFQINKKHCDSLFGAFRTTNFTSPAFKKTTESLYRSYAPIEGDPHMDLEQKKLLLKEWYDAVKICFLHENITIEKCMGVLNESNIGVRYGYREFLNLCKVINLPYYMISGGITEMVQTILAKAIDLRDYPNFFTFSNDMIFDKQGKLVDMDMKVYATTKSGILDQRNFSFKGNTLLFGDLLTDYDMSSKMGDQNLIAIGFLDPNNEKMLSNYIEKFDIVILGDGDFLLHDKIIRYIANVHENPQLKERIEGNSVYKEILRLFEDEN